MPLWPTTNSASHSTESPHFRITLVMLFAVVFLSAAAACSMTGETPEASREVTTPETATTTAIPTRTPEPTSTATSTPLPACRFEAGTVVHTVYPGVVVREDIPVVVYLPPCYDELAETYPVLYLLHGFGSGMDETQWEQLGVLTEADARFRAGVPSYIIVMPLQPDPIFINSMGGTGSYEQEMLEGLIPSIDSTYRTREAPQDRALAGISRGGVWALEIAFRNPDVFNVVAGLSPALHVNYALPPYDPFLIAAGAEDLPHNILLTAGDAERDFRLAVLELSAALEEADVEHQVQVVSGGHQNETWSQQVPQLLDFIEGSW